MLKKTQNIIIIKYPGEGDSLCSKPSAFTPFLSFPMDLEQIPNMQAGRSMCTG